MQGMGIRAANGIKNTSTNSRTSACAMPEMGVRPPLLALAAVRAMAPVAGMPPNRTDPMLPMPCATSSMLQRWCELIIESATTHESSDSIAAKMAMVMPLASSSRNNSKLSAGAWNWGKPPEIVYKSPIVLTFIPRPPTKTQPASTETMEAGILSVTMGQKIKMARHREPTISASMLKVPRFAAMACSFSAVSMVWVPVG